MRGFEGLIDEAPGSLRTLAAAITTWVHRDRLEAVRERLADQYGYHLTATPEPYPAPVALAGDPSPGTPSPGDPLPDSALHLRLPAATPSDAGSSARQRDRLSSSATSALGPSGRPGSPRNPSTGGALGGTGLAGHDWPGGLAAGDVSGSAGPACDDAVDDTSAEVSTASYVVLALPDRWRVVEPGHIEVCDGERSWCGTRTLVTESPGEPAPVSEAGVIAICLYPGRFVGGLTFGPPVADRLQGRDCWFVEAHPGAVGTSLGDVRLAAALRLWIGRHLSEFVGVEHRFWFDAATGIVLRHEGAIDGLPCSAIELTDVVFDGPVPASEFATPPGAVVRSRHELLRDHLADLGVDPDTVDLDDPLQVRLALRRGISG